MFRSTKKSLRLVALGASIALLASGCASGDEPGTTPEESTPDNGGETSGLFSEEAHALLPESIRNSGELKIATSLTWPPFDYKDENGQAAGIEIGLVEKLGEVLGVDVEVTDIDWQSLVPSVANGRFDIVMNQLEDTPDRRQQAQFVHYYQDSLAVLSIAGVEIDPESLCGELIAVTQGSSQVATIERISDECVAAGEPAINAQTFAESAATILAVQNGRTDAMLMGRAGAVYLQSTEASDLQVSEAAVPGTEALTGLVIAKDNDELAVAVQAALQVLLEDGWYEEYLAEFSVEAGALDEITIGKD